MLDRLCSMIRCGGALHTAWLSAPRRRIHTLALLPALLAAAAGAATADVGSTERVSVASDGSEGSGASPSASLVPAPAVSADGRFGAFSNASAQVAGGPGAPEASQQIQQWFWQNPLPQGNPLSDVSFTDASTGTAVGAGGTIVRTEDGGASWTIQESGTTNNLHAVSFTDASTGTVVGDGGTILRTTDGGASWTAQPSGTPKQLWAVSFTDASTGTVVGSRGTIVRTTDGGSTWTDQSIDIPNTLFGVFFSDASTGTAVGTNGTILRTTDGGSTWTTQSAGLGPISFSDVSFTDANTGWVVGEYIGNGLEFAAIIHTTDGGQTWTVQSNPATTNLLDVSFIDANTGWAVGEQRFPNNAVIVHTTDGGSTWTAQASGSPVTLRGVSFTDANTGTTVGSGGKIIHTTDGGSTWTEASSGTTTNSFNGVSFTDANTGTVVGCDGTILRTTDGGSTWTAQESGTTLCLRAVSFTDASTGTAVGNEGAILRTTDGGSTWTAQESGTMSTLNAVSFTGASTGTAVGSGGTILRTTDGGSTWTAQESGTTTVLRGVSFTDASTGTAVGFSGTILRTTDGGSTWTAQESGTPFNLNAVSFTDANTGTAVGGGGRILRTTDGGSTWTDQSVGTNGGFNAVSFTDTNTGTAVGIGGTGGLILRTTDGGTTWTVQPSGTVNGLFGVSFTDASTGTAVGVGGTILRTNTTIDPDESFWTVQASGTTESLFGVSFTDADTGTAVGQNGTILRTTDGGSTWIDQSIETPSPFLSLNGVSFTDANTGTAVGDEFTGAGFEGAIFRTTDGGSTWTAQESGTTSFLQDVSFTDADTGTVVGSDGTILRTTDGGATWTAQTSGTTAFLRGVSFTDANTGTVVGGDGTILRTTDGGSTWTAQVSGTTSTLNAVSFTDANTGTAVGLSGTIVRTTDGGSTWTAQVSGTGHVLNDVSFTDANTGTAVGGGGNIVHTTDGGLLWTAQASGTTNTLLGVSFTDASTGTAVGLSGVILRKESPPEVDLDPALLDFGPVLVGQTRGPLSVAVTNASPDAVTFDEISGPQAPFSAAGGTCGATPFTLGPQESCTLDFSYSPTAVGAFFDNVTLISDESGSSYTITLQGVGSEDALNIAPDLLDFGTAGTGDPLSVTLTNADTVTTITVSAVNGPAAPFVAAGGTCDDVPFSLEPSASCSLAFTFNPTDTGSFSDTVEVISDADGSPNTFDLVGEAILLELTFTPEQLDFGELTVGTTSPPQTALLRNTGDVNVTDLSLEGLPASGFTLDASDCGSTLPAEASCEVGVTFTPTALGPAAAVLVATAAQGTQASLHLNGSGVAPEPRIGVDPGSLTSVLPQGQMETQSLTISNTGAAPLDWEVTGGSALAGGVLRPAGPVTPVTTRPAPQATDGFTRPAVRKGAEASASHRFPTPLGADVLLTHSQSPLIQTPNTAACTPGGNSAQNSFLRTFALADFGITGDFGVSSVTFGIEVLNTTAPITVNLHTLEGDLTFDNLSLIGSATREFLAGSLELVTVPVTGTAPAGSTLVVEISVPALSDGAFFPGSNGLGETAPSYIAASACGAPEPVTYASVGFPNVHLVMAVIGAPVVPDCTIPGWLQVAPTSGTVAVGDTQLADVTFDATGVAPGDHQANLCLASNDDATPLLPVPLLLTVTGPDGEEGYTPVALTVDPEGLISDGNGIFEPGERVDVAPWWRNDSGLAPVLMGTASGFAGPPDATYNLVADTADYGPIEPGQMASCLDTAVCYTLELGEPAVRPAPHWEATFDETLDDSDGTAKTWTLHIGDSFTDVPTTNPFYSSIETLLHSGITGGCADGTYCPSGTISRSQLPVFVLRALEGPEYVPQACAEDAEEFSDVPASNPFCGWIEELHRRNVVSGCGGGAYCPNDPVTRAQMAIFLLKTLEGDGYTPTECTERFTDVPCSSLFADWIEDLAAREITGGCSADAYCPADPVSRAQMATFVTRAFGLTLYGP